VIGLNFNSHLHFVDYLLTNVLKCLCLSHVKRANSGNSDLRPVDDEHKVLDSGSKALVVLPITSGDPSSISDNEGKITMSGVRHILKSVWDVKQQSLPSNLILDEAFKNSSTGLEKEYFESVLAPRFLYESDDFLEPLMTPTLFSSLEWFRKLAADTFNSGPTTPPPKIYPDTSDNESVFSCNSNASTPVLVIHWFT